MMPDAGMLYLTTDAAERIDLPVETLAAREGEAGEAFLSRAQQALYELREKRDYVCVLSRDWAGIAALALAEQLMVDRLILTGDVFAGEPSGMRGLRAYARRNLSLIAAECVLIGVPDACARAMARALGRQLTPVNVTEILKKGELSVRRLYIHKITCRKRENVYNILSDAFWKGRNQ